MTLTSIPRITRREARGERDRRSPVRPLSNDQWNTLEVAAITGGLEPCCVEFFGNEPRGPMRASRAGGAALHRVVGQSREEPTHFSGTLVRRPGRGTGKPTAFIGLGNRRRGGQHNAQRA
jgi:hypothetical protein